MAVLVLVMVGAPGVLADSSSASEANGHVVELDATGFEQVDKGTWLVEFYAPWCGHCKNLEPTWEALARSLADRPDVHVAKVDATKEEGLAQLMGVRGYPTIKAFSAGRVFDFAGRDRELPTLQDWAGNFASANTGQPFKVRPTTVDRVWAWMERYSSEMYVTVVHRPEMAATLLLMGFLCGILFALLAFFPSQAKRQPAEQRTQAHGDARGPKPKKE